MDPSDGAFVIWQMSAASCCWKSVFTLEASSATDPGDWIVATDHDCFSCRRTKLLSRDVLIDIIVRPCLETLIDFFVPHHGGQELRRKTMHCLLSIGAGKTTKRVKPVSLWTGTIVHHSLCHYISSTPLLFGGLDQTRHKHLTQHTKLLLPTLVQVLRASSRSSALAKSFR